LFLKLRSDIVRIQKPYYKQLNYFKIKTRTPLTHIIILIAISSSLFAQQYEYIPFPTENAIWSEVYYPRNEEEPILERFALNGEDTLIGN